MTNVSVGYDVLDNVVSLYLLLKGNAIIKHGGLHANEINIPSCANINEVFLFISYDDALTESDTNFCIYTYLADSSKVYECKKRVVLEDGCTLLFLNVHANNTLFEHIEYNKLFKYGKDELLNALRYYIDKSVDLLSFKDINVNNTDSITLSDINGHVLWANKNYEILTGRTLANMVGKRPRQSMYGNHSVYVEAGYVDSNIAKKQPFYFENIAYHITDRQYWFSALVYPIINSKGDIVGRIHIMNDITERKLKELDIQTNDNILKLALDTKNIGAWTLNLLNKELSITGKINSSDAFNDSTNKFQKLADIVSTPEKIAIYRKLLSISPNNPDFEQVLKVPQEGKTRYYRTRGKCILWDSNSYPIVLVGTIIDITDETQYLQELQVQKQFYNSILDRLPADVVVWNKKHVYTYINASAITNTETRNWLIGKDDFDYCKYRGIDISVAENRRNEFSKLLEKKLPIRFIEKLTNKGLQYKLRIMQPLMNNGDIDYVIGYGIDITEQMKSEELAIKQRVNLERLLEVSSEGIIRINTDGVIIDSNTTFKNLFKFKGQILRRKIETLFDKDEHKIFLKDVSLVVLSESVTGRLTFEHADNNSVSYFNYAALYIEGGDMVLPEIIIRFHDVTKLIENETLLKRNVQKEVLLNKQKSQFIRITSHELRTPLTVIKSSAEILNLILNNKEQSQYVNDIVAQADFMTSLLNQLMIASKIESNAIKINKEKYTISDFLQSITIERYKPYTDGRVLDIEVEDMEIELFVDINLFTIAIGNLLENAFKYSPGAKPPLLKIYKNIKTGKNVFEVKDNGIGIPDFEVRSLGQPFFRASNVKNIGGTGIGMMIVYYYASMHNGEIKITSQLGTGTTVMLET